MSASVPSTVTVARWFNEFARKVYPGRSPLYERLAYSIAEDPELLALAAESRRDTAFPNLFLGAVHFLLLTGVRHPLSAFYPSVSATPAKQDFVFPFFRSFVFEHREEIRQIISTRLVQTNEVGRCAVLLPAFGLVARELNGMPLALVDVGASAGLNLLWDRYAYDYGDGIRRGDPDSQVLIECSLKGKNRPVIPESFPRIGSRVGVDLNPVNLNDPESVMWLRALVWPEHQRRVKQLQEAIEVVRRDPPRIVKGNALEILPDVLSSVPEERALCVYHCLVTTFLSQGDRESLESIVVQQGMKRPVFHISLEMQVKMDRAQLELAKYDRGSGRKRLLAYCNSHGEWLEWLHKRR